MLTKDIDTGDIELTCALRGVEGLVSLDEDVPGLEGHQDDFLQQSVREPSLQVHVLLDAGIFTEVTSRDLKHHAEKKAEHEEQRPAYT